MFLRKRHARGASRFEVKSDFACYRPGEIPSLSVQLSRPKGDLEKLASKDCAIEVRDDRDQLVSRLNLTFDVENTVAKASAKLSDSPKLAPGLYKVHARTTLDSVELTHTSGFWIYDEALMTRGKPFTVDKHFFYRDGTSVSCYRHDLHGFGRASTIPARSEPIRLGQRLPRNERRGREHDPHRNLDRLEELHDRKRPDE